MMVMRMIKMNMIVVIILSNWPIKSLIEYIAYIIDQTHDDDIYRYHHDHDYEYDAHDTIKAKFHYLVVMKITKMSHANFPWFMICTKLPGKCHTQRFSYLTFLQKMSHLTFLQKIPLCWQSICFCLGQKYSSSLAACSAFICWTLGQADTRISRTLDWH